MTRHSVTGSPADAWRSKSSEEEEEKKETAITEASSLLLSEDLTCCLPAGGRRGEKLPVYMAHLTKCSDWDVSKDVSTDEDVQEFRVAPHQHDKSIQSSGLHLHQHHCNSNLPKTVKRHVEAIDQIKVTTPPLTSHELRTHNWEAEGRPRGGLHL
ncbi:hypothetical protein NQZ68_012096 [Dissostichus eleginoides]|nr:hypothetical protein NQZ68_012096 [Dissostichus eleginoides]